MPYIIDYKEQVKNLISEAYEPANMISQEFKYTTYQIVRSLKNILPDNAIDEHLVYEVLQELGFKPEEEKPLKFFWYFRRKKND